MGTVTCPEIREINVTSEERAQAYDSRVREIDRIVRESWSELASICIQVRDRALWKLVLRPTLDVEPFKDFDDWLLDAAPVCRSTVYKGMGILSVLAKDLTPEQIAGIEIGNASILAYEVSSPSVRRDPEVIEAARSGRHSKKLREVVMRKYPNQAIENVVERKLRFTRSQWEVIDSAWDVFKITDPSASLETFIEYLVSEVMSGEDIGRAVLVEGPKDSELLDVDWDKVEG